MPLDARWGQSNKVLPFLYDKEIVSEEAVLRWAEEKEHADESDKVFVKQRLSFRYICCTIVGFWFLFSRI
jgi:hypothetical protein